MQPKRPSKLLRASTLLIGSVLIAACSSRAPITPDQIQSTVSVSPEAFNTALPPTATPTLAPSPTPPPPVVITFEPSTARDLISSAFTKLNTAYPFRVTEQTTIGDGQPLQRVAELNAIDQSHATFNTGEETIRLGDLLYTKSNGQWSAAAHVPLNPQAPANLAAALITNVERAASVGTETISGVDSNVLSYDLKATIGQVVVEGSGQVWIGTADGLPRQITFTGTAGSASIKSVIVYDEFGSTFTIQAPN